MLGLSSIAECRDRMTVLPNSTNDTMIKWDNQNIKVEDQLFKDGTVAKVIKIKGTFLEKQGALIFGATEVQLNDKRTFVIIIPVKKLKRDLYFTHVKWSGDIKEEQYVLTVRK